MGKINSWKAWFKQIRQSIKQLICDLLQNFYFGLFNSTTFPLFSFDFLLKDPKMEKTSKKIFCIFFLLHVTFLFKNWCRINFSRNMQKFVLICWSDSLTHSLIISKMLTNNSFPIWENSTLEKTFLLKDAFWNNKLSILMHREGDCDSVYVLVTSRINFKSIKMLL